MEQTPRQAAGAAVPDAGWTWLSRDGREPQQRVPLLCFFPFPPASFRFFFPSLCVRYAPRNRKSSRPLNAHGLDLGVLDAGPPPAGRSKHPAAAPSSQPAAQQSRQTNGVIQTPAQPPELVSTLGRRGGRHRHAQPGWFVSSLTRKEKKETARVPIHETDMIGRTWSSSLGPPPPQDPEPQKPKTHNHPPTHNPQLPASQPPQPASLFRNMEVGIPPAGEHTAGGQHCSGSGRREGRAGQGRGGIPLLQPPPLDHTATTATP